MAEKKKTTTSKSGAKTSAAKKTTTKAKSVAKKATTKATKKVTPKKTTAKKAVKSTSKSTTAKKKVAPKKTVAKKTTAKKTNKSTATMHSMKRQGAPSAVSYMDWENVVKAAFKAFPKLWWRVGLVNVTSLILILLSFALSAVVTLAGFGGVASFENALANIKFGLGFDMSAMVALSIGVFVFFNLMIVVSVLGKIANFLVVKNHLNGETRNPLAIYFVDAWAYFWRYLFLGFWVMWYIVWPLLVFLLGLSVMGIAADLLDLPDVLMIPLAVAVIITMFCYLIYRSIQMFFYQSVLVHSDANTRNSFNLTLSLVKGNWWGVFLSVFVFFTLAWVVQMTLNIPSIMAEFMSVSGVAVIVSSLLDFIFSFFILAPISVTFMYFLMLQVAKNKAIDLK